MVYRSYLEDLGLSANMVDARITFLFGCAHEHLEQARVDRPGLGRRGGQGGSRSEGDTDSWNKIARFGAAATLFAEAGQLALLEGGHKIQGDDGRRRGLKDAAEYYRKAALPYGLLLEAMRMPGEAAAKFLFSEGRVADAVRQIDQWYAQSRARIPDTPSEEERKRLIELPPELSEPNQQIYLCLAIVGVPVVGRELHQSVARVLDALRVHNNIAHGPHGLPLETYRDFAETLLAVNLGVAQTDIYGRSERALAEIAWGYQRSLQAARHNAYLWENFWSPVEYLDLELVACAAFLARAGDRRGEAVLKELRLPTIGRIPIEIGHELFGPEVP